MSVWMTSRYIFDPPYIKQQKRAIDGIGIGLLALGIGCLQFVLDKGQTEDWFASHLITALMIAGLGTLIIFIIYALRAKNPVLDLRVFKDRTYSTGVFLMTVL